MARKSIRRVLQRRGTGLFLRRDGSFTCCLKEAHCVGSVTEALRICRKHGLKEMDMVLKLNGDGYDIHLQLTDS